MSYETPEPSLTPEEPKVAHYCDCCGGEIYKGEEYYEFDSDSAFTLESTCICKDCVRCARRVAE